MEKITSNIDVIKMDFEMLAKNRTPISVPRKEKGDTPICKFFLLPTGCKNKDLCPFRHIRKHFTIVCKHWLQGLCRKGTECEFMHTTKNLQVPECFFFSQYQACIFEDCKFLHLKPKENPKSCTWYEKGYCKKGPYCKYGHIKKHLCRNYLAGFCPLGPNCENGHPKYELPVVFAKTIEKQSDVKEIITCTTCGNDGHDSSHCFKMRSSNTDKLPQVGISQEQNFRPLGEVTCFKCGEKGHYANKCAKRRIAFLTQRIAKKRELYTNLLR